MSNQIGIIARFFYRLFSNGYDNYCVRTGYDIGGCCCDKCIKLDIIREKDNYEKS